MKREEFYAKDRRSWRAWLKANHAVSKGVWLIYDKARDGARALAPDGITEEALCFGWIDSVPKKLSTTQAMLYVSPRKPKSNWSALNRERAVRMIKLGKMHVSGQKLIDLAKQSGTWAALDGVQRLIIPQDLKKALSSNTAAKENFNSSPPSSKRIILEWILNAKKTETREKRIQETVVLASKNIRANHYRQ